MVLKNVINSQDQDHQKGKDTREVSHALQKVHLAMMLKKAINNQDQDHQKGKDTTEVGHDVGKVHLTIMVKNAVNNQDQDHQKGKDTTEVGHNLCKVHLTIMLENAVNSKKSWSRSPKKSPHDHSRPKVSPQVAINSSQENSSLNRGLSQSTILNSDKCRWPEVSHHVHLNSTQEKAIFNRTSVRGRSRSPKCPNDQQKPEASLRVQPNSSSKNSLFSRGRS